MDREIAESLARFVVDDAMNGRKLHSDPHAIVHEVSTLVGWNYGKIGQPFFVSVHSYLGLPLTDSEAVELALDYLSEIGIFVPTTPDYIFPPSSK